MHPIVLLPAALLVCSCTQTSERTSATKVDSAVAVDSASALQGSAGSAKAAARAPADSRCGLKGNPVLTDLGIGNLAVGRTATTIQGSCRVIRDIGELTSEGTLERVLTVMIGGDVYRATVVDGLVRRISVSSRRIATRDGFRIGTPLSRVAALKGAKIAEGDEGLYLLTESHCGLTFRFSIPSRLTTGRRWTMEELIQRHGNEPVDGILVTRCVRSG